MRYVFIDESGEFGMDFTKDKTSKYFVITALETTDKKPIEKAVTRVFKSIKSKKRINSLHANRDSDAIRKKLLSELAKCDFRITAVVIDKKKQVLGDFHSVYKGLLRATMSYTAFYCIYEAKPAPAEISLCISRLHTKTSLNEDIVNIFSNNKRDDLIVKTEIKPPNTERCLQAVDFISWAIFRKFEYGDESFFKIIKSKIFNFEIPPDLALGR